MNFQFSGIVCAGKACLSSWMWKSNDQTTSHDCAPARDPTPVDMYTNMYSLHLTISRTHCITQSHNWLKAHRLSCLYWDDRYNIPYAIARTMSDARFMSTKNCLNAFSNLSNLCSVYECVLYGCGNCRTFLVVCWRLSLSLVSVYMFCHSYTSMSTHECITYIREQAA